MLNFSHLHKLLRTRQRSPACILFYLAIAISPQISFADNNLPDIGGPASAELSPAKEAELGRILVPEVRGHLPVSNDPELNQYILSLGTRIISGGLNADSPFTFLLVIDPDINAFALPGGIVAINTGLLTLSQQESELASVFAHEIAHVTQRHIARNFVDKKAFSVISALTLFGAILAAAYDGELGKAAIITAQAGLQQSQLAYSRGFEQEADRVGMHLMVSANIDPQGMPMFFDRLDQHTQLHRGQVPEFLSSHPLTLNRISESKSRATQYRGAFTSNTVHFNYARARTIALTSNPTQLINQFWKKNSSQEKLNNTENYTYALALSRAGKTRQALRHLQKVAINSNNELTIKLAIAQVNIAAGQIATARQALESLEQIYPDNLPVIYHLATSLIKDGRARLALQKLDRLSNTSQQNPIVDQLKAKAASKAGMPWRSHESLSDYYVAHGRYGTAMEQIQLSLRAPGIDENSKARVEAKKAQLYELRRRRKEFN